MQDLVHQLSRTLAEGRPIGMALALAAMQARTLEAPLDLALIEPLAADCQACLSDVACQGQGDVPVPLDPDTLLVLHIAAVLDAGYTLDFIPVRGAHRLITGWMRHYPPHIRVQRVLSTEAAVVADTDTEEALLWAS